MITLASSLSAASLSAACARAASTPSSSMSNTFPWRTLATPATPSNLSAPSIALPCGSRMPDFNLTVTWAFMALSVAQSIAANRRRRNGSVHGCVGVRPGEQPAEPRKLASFAHETQRRPESRLGARHHRHAAACFDRRRDAQRAQAAARDQQRLRRARLAAYFEAEIDDVGL